MLDNRALGNHICPTTQRSRLLIECLKCRGIDCTFLTKEKRAILLESPYVKEELIGFVPRREHMYLFKFNDGHIEDSYEGFNPDSPDLERLKEVEEVLVINKVLVKQVRLVPKARDERPVEQQESQQEQTVVRRRRRRRNNQ